MTHRYVHVTVPVFRQTNTKSKLHTVRSYYPNDNIFACLRLPVKCSPTHIRHFSPSALPLNELNSYHDNMGLCDQYDRYRTSSIGDSHQLLNHPHQEVYTGGYPIDDDGSYLYDIDFGNVIQSRTQTTILPCDYPFVYQPQQRASI